MTFRPASARLAAPLAAVALALTCAAGTTGAIADPPPDGHRAGEDERIRTKGGTAWFFHVGEVVKVKDTRRDDLGNQRGCSELQAAIA